MNSTTVVIMAELLPIWRLTPCNQSTNQSINQSIKLYRINLKQNTNDVFFSLGRHAYIYINYLGEPNLIKIRSFDPLP